MSDATSAATVANVSTTVYQAFVKTARAAPAADFLFTDATTAVQYQIAAGALPYGDVLARVEQLRRRFADAGFGHGHRVGLLLENRPAFFIYWLALNALGVSVVPIHGDMRQAELSYLIEHSEVAMIIALDDRLELVRNAVAAADVAADVAAHAAARPAAILRSDRYGAAISDAPWPAPLATQTPSRETECALLYTSGTTGRPKGCVLSNDYYLLAGDWYARVGGLCALRPGVERMITPLPQSHMNAMAYSTMAMIVTGGCLVQLDRFHPNSWWASVRESRATIAHYLGVMPAMLLAAPAQPSDREHHLRFGFGAGVDKRQHSAFEARFGFPLLEAWAMTETGAGAVIIANSEPRQVGQSCFGRALPALEYQLVDEALRPVAAGEPGELWVRAAGANPRRGFFTEYLKDAQASDEAWSQGWFHTGDVVRVDSDGNFYFIDRRKNVIRRSGENISAVEVESVLASHAKVKAVAVAATPDEMRGDEVIALVVLKVDAVDGDKLEPEAIAHDIVRHSLAQLGYHKAPGYVAFVSELPLTLSQKIQRGELKLLARALPGQPNCIDTRHLKKRGGEAPRAGASGPATASSSSRSPSNPLRVAKGYDDIAVAVPVTVPYERYSTHGAHWFLGRTLAALIKQAGIQKNDIDGLCVSSFSLGPDSAVGLTQHLGLSPRYLEHLPYGGASGVVAVRRAARAVQAGDADIVACIAGDTNHVDSFRQMLGSFSVFARDATYPYGSGGPNSMFAFITAHYMRTHGVRREDFARICIAQRSNALNLPHAMFRKPLSLDDYMNARVIADPIHLFDCVMPCAGGEGVLVMSKARARDLGLSFVSILAAAERHNAFAEDPIMTRGGWSLDRAALFGQAGVTPGDLDLVQFYDDYPVIVMMQYEGHGFCEAGEAAQFVAANSLTIDGSLPTNTSGGQLSAGQAGAAGGYIGLVETVRQLTGRPLSADKAGMVSEAKLGIVKDAKLGLVSGFGMVTYDRCLCTGALILAADQ